MQSIVYPSITTNNHVKFENQLLSYIKFSDYLHIDFADGTRYPEPPSSSWAHAFAGK
jgi:pentose-5-phosphate-3-epimerase